MNNVFTLLQANTITTLTLPTILPRRPVITLHQVIPCLPHHHLVHTTLIALICPVADRHTLTTHLTPLTLRPDIHHLHQATTMSTPVVRLPIQNQVRADIAILCLLQGMFLAHA